MTQFTDLGLSQKLLDALKQEGYETPTPIQAQSIPPLLQGKDLLGIAQTGTGKTAAFALPILELLSRHTERVAKGTCRALILSPTRELAAQIGESFKTYGKYMKLSRAIVFGGTSIGKQVEICRGGVDILVATPGRLVDLIERRAITLGKVEILVLDEVDQMLDLGFIHAIRQITGMLPKQRQNLFFSATMPKEIAGLAAGLLRDPVRIEITPVATTVERINQSVIHVDQGAKLALLNELLKDNNMTRTLVFTRTKHGADKVVRGLAQANYTASAIHGNKSQANREKALAGFKNGKILVLVATDIAARGIDVDGVSHVINFDLPHVPESYVHRIGRTARAGAEGMAIALCAGDERSLLRDIERTIRMSIPVVTHALGRAVLSPEGKEARRPNGRSTKPQGGKPRGERSFAPRGDRPQGERPQGERSFAPRGDRPQDDHPQGEHSFAPRGDRPQGDRPQGERSFAPRGDRPQGGKFHRGQPGFTPKPKVETASEPRHVHEEKASAPAVRTDWTPMKGEPTIMYQKKQERTEARPVQDNKPWFNRNGKTAGSKNMDRKARGDKPGFAGKPKAKFGGGKPGGFAKPTGGNFKRPDRAEA
ncbi:MAG: DEAD/DEAH box helicase [Aestuariivirga sp.]